MPVVWFLTQQPTEETVQAPGAQGGRTIHTRFDGIKAHRTYIVKKGDAELRAQFNPVLFDQTECGGYIVYRPSAEQDKLLHTNTESMPEESST